MYEPSDPSESPESPDVILGSFLKHTANRLEERAWLCDSVRLHVICPWRSLLLHCRYYFLRRSYIHDKSNESSAQQVECPYSVHSSPLIRHRQVQKVFWLLRGSSVIRALPSPVSFPFFRIFASRTNALRKSEFSRSSRPRSTIPTYRIWKDHEDSWIHIGLGALSALENVALIGDWSVPVTWHSQFTTQPFAEHVSLPGTRKYGLALGLMSRSWQIIGGPWLSTFVHDDSFSVRDDARDNFCSRTFFVKSDDARTFDRISSFWYPTLLSNTESPQSLLRPVRGSSHNVLGGLNILCERKEFGDGVGGLLSLLITDMDDDDRDNAGSDSGGESK